MGIRERLARRALDSHTGRLMEAIRVGWNNYNFIFYIGGVSAILGGLFGIAGWASAVVTVVFFYEAGKFKQKIEEEKEKRTKALRLDKKIRGKKRTA